MYKAVATLVVAIFACTQLSNAAVPAAVGLRSLVGLGDPKWEIRDGNCTHATMTDLIYQEHVHKHRLPFSTRDATVEWFGDENIYCVMAISEKVQATGSTVEILRGGVGHNFVSLHMKSAKNHGLEYNIQIFGKYKR
ncbi:unnamed protein product [Acanthoscelides obtectus]|uniref:Uncharacterized protein n=1 Tax=Acanthoscelides obtectus TaxID=200917 RepID=A0A9P0LC11_ACAOB|nr:unnamed protein product [Acanthoscelides obtectus]CAK1655201.1 hypothetical protein AOBTE_LOCUS19077 [Acanthoscelides obtectus]